MTARNGHAEWWLNRKSRLGLSPAARPPPHLPSGAEWWTEPPTSAPEPEFIEYVTAYRLELIRTMANAGALKRRRTAALLTHANAWLAVARRLLHERAQAPERSDLHTTDGMIVAASRTLQRLGIYVHQLGGELDDEARATMQAVLARAEEIRRRRATSASCPPPPLKAVK